MDAAREDPEIAEKKWAAAAAANGYHCTMCGTVPPHSERAIFFARDVCSWCAKEIDRDDLASTRTAWGRLRRRRIASVLDRCTLATAD